MYIYTQGNKIVNTNKLTDIELVKVGNKSFGIRASSGLDYLTLPFLLAKDDSYETVEKEYDNILKALQNGQKTYIINHI